MVGGPVPPRLEGGALGEEPHPFRAERTEDGDPGDSQGSSDSVPREKALTTDPSNEHHLKSELVRGFMARSDVGTSGSGSRTAT